MSKTVYDRHQEFYINFVDRVLADESSVWHLLLARFNAILGRRLHNARVCDVACGEGYLSRFLAKSGAREVIGVDISAALIETAVKRSNLNNLSFHVDDAHRLNTLTANSFDIAVSQMALMDIPDHQAMFQAVHRILKHGGLFAFSLLHPCFESPFHAGESAYLEDEDGHLTAVLVRRYGTEGHWRSGGDGVRGHMGAYHRMLSTYINDLLAAGFRLEKLEEPLDEDGSIHSQIPRTMIVVGTAE